MHLPGVKLVTFDVTNTLLRFRMPPYDYYALVARSYGYKGTGVDIKKQLKSSYIDLTKQYPNFGRNSISWKKWWTYVVEKTFQGNLPMNTQINEISTQLIEDFKTSACWEIVDGGADLITLLKRSGIVVGVISNFDPRLHDILANLGINSYFEFVITSYEVGICKPDKKIFECAEYKYGKNISPRQCLHIGDDMDKDYNGAKAAGWHALLITNISLKSNHCVNAYCNLKDLYSAIENSKVKLM